MKIYKKPLLLLGIIILFLGIKFSYEIIHSPFEEAISHTDRMTIFYRPGCPRCKKALPKLVIPAFFSIKREYFINANNLTQNQLNKIGLYRTPGFYTHGKIYQTVDESKIRDLWSQR